MKLCFFSTLVAKQTVTSLTSKGHTEGAAVMETAAADGENN